jgi:hypothetical protein
LKKSENVSFISLSSIDYNTDIRSSQVTYVRESAAKCSFVQNKQTQTKWERGEAGGLMVRGVRWLLAVTTAGGGSRRFTTLYMLMKLI